MLKTFVSVAMLSLLAACAPGQGGGGCPCSQHKMSCADCCKGHCKECCHGENGGHCPHNPQ